MISLQSKEIDFFAEAGTITFNNDSHSSAVLALQISQIIGIRVS